jgi:hypothetical protein
LATPSAYSTSPTETGTATFAIPPSQQALGTHVLAVLVHVMAHDEDGGANDAFKAARGLTGATLTGDASAITWKIQGDQGGENLLDTVRGPLNNGGLYGERAGWYLPGYPDAGWGNVTLPYSDPDPGVAWYRTNFTLHEPAGVDASLGLTITDTTANAYRALIFLNGWNIGQYVNTVGPQTTFVLPNGILHTGIADSGANTLAIAVITNNPAGVLPAGTAGSLPAGAGASAPASLAGTGGGLGAVALTNLGTMASGLQVADVSSPGYQPPSATAAAVTAVAGRAFTGRVAEGLLARDARGSALAARIDWGDGSSSAGTVTRSADGYSVTGEHAYSLSGRYPVTVRLSDQYGASTLATATGTASVASASSGLAAAREAAPAHHRQLTRGR